KGTEDEKKSRAAAIEAASKYAMEIPFATAELSLQSMEVMRAMVEQGNPNSITDAGVGALCARTAVLGAVMNVRVNAQGIKDKTFADSLAQRASALEQQAEKLEAAIRATIASHIGGA
ncbi:MAG: cyclodeaminase/cyclohydrolase family protein, partial [Bacteroidota bacterium]